MKRLLRGRRGNEGMTQAAAPRKRQAVTSTRSSSTKALIQDNATTSPLLRLPPEIRTQIFRLLFSDQLIHILHTEGWPRPGFRHCVCTAAQSEDEAYKEFIDGYSVIPSGQDPQYYAPPFKQRHAACKHWDREDGRFFTDAERFQWRSTPTVDRPCNWLSLSLLSVCRQTYEEASFLLWTTNTFSFEDPLTLGSFMSGRNSVQRKRLTAVHLDTQWGQEVLDAWAKLMTPAFLKKFSGLRTLHVTYDQNFNFVGIWQPQRPTLSMRDQDIEPCQDRKAPVKRMRILPLKHVTVIMADGVVPGMSLVLDDFRWTVAQKREVADLLRRKLLDPDGHKLTAEQLQAETAHARKLLRMPEGKWI